MRAYLALGAYALEVMGRQDIGSKEIINKSINSLFPSSSTFAITLFRVPVSTEWENSEP